MRLLTPIFLKNRRFCSRCVLRRKENMPTFMALVSFIIQKAPPIIRMKTIIWDVWLKPLKKEVKICHVWGSLSICWKVSAITIFRSVPSTTTVWRWYSPPGRIQVRMAQRMIIEKTIVNVCGILNFELISLRFGVQKYIFVAIFSSKLRNILRLFCCKCWFVVFKEGNFFWFSQKRKLPNAYLVVVRAVGVGGERQNHRNGGGWVLR